MLAAPAPYQLRALQLADLDAVYAIDRLAFPTPSKKGLYEYELTRNPMAHYQALLLENVLLGYVGYWLIADEAHISTIATHPDWRGKKLGELLLLNMLYMAGEHPATQATLEVRRSNTIAQALYRKYAFIVEGERPRYYRDTGDDALIMTVILNDNYYAHTLNALRQALWVHLTSAPSAP
ncbi:MAG: ribosomal protein S18-alanine N-acetyltransferase [Ardenticatenaceae bacterium]|nr:ribosomal protein S18-alanine N-acetyltransferase [Ardenticatenaceae bacterium]MCB8989734.1 ribosomal protein S18-alanine N-acetyltransferase [Ardenticatenaceae bacterium]MCB9002807.1 ribosomal protein S18-alanine N-acetyltransferase [Ardenticatenaceae bacterium]